MQEQIKIYIKLCACASITILLFFVVIVVAFTMIFKFKSEADTSTSSLYQLITELNESISSVSLRLNQDLNESVSLGLNQEPKEGVKICLVELGMRSPRAPKDKKRQIRIHYMIIYARIDRSVHYFFSLSLSSFRRSLYLILKDVCAQKR